MPRSIVIFGPASVGKSTLAGYLCARLAPDQDYIQRKINRWRREPWYKEDQKYSYFCDRAIDERDEEHLSRKCKKKFKEGTTKYAEAATVSLGSESVTLLDTPGAEHRSKERDQGIFLGEIGIFTVECPRELYHSMKPFPDAQAVMYLAMWSNVFQKKTPPIVVLTKMDLAEFSEDDYAEASRRIRLATGESHIVVVPIAINVSKEEDHNVICKSTELPWYTGDTFIKLLEHAIQDAYEKEERQSLLVSMFHTERHISFPGTGRIWRGKILEGTLRREDTVKVVPCEFLGNVVPSVHAKIRNLRFEQGEDTDEALEGHIVGIDLNEVKVDGRGVSKSDLRILGYSVIVRPEQNFELGCLLQFELEQDDILNIANRGEAMVLWYGYYVSMKVVYKVLRDDKGVLILQMDNGLLAAPLNSEGGLRYSNFMIKVRENEGTNYVTVRAQLKAIGENLSISLSFGSLQVNIEKINKIMVELPYEYDNELFKFRENINGITILRRLENIAEYLDIESENVLIDAKVIPKIAN